jgi:hypothetical protein
VTVNWSVDLGQILSVVAMVLLAIGAHFAVKQTVTVVVARFDDFKLSMEKTVKAFGERLDKHEASIMGLVGDCSGSSAGWMARWTGRTGRTRGSDHRP